MTPGQLAGAQINVRRASARERIVTLDGKERLLNDGMLVIADGSRPVVIAGIMGGQDSGVGPGTTDLVLECAIFRRQSVRATSRRLGLSSDFRPTATSAGSIRTPALEAAHRRPSI